MNFDKRGSGVLTMMGKVPAAGRSLAFFAWLALCVCGLPTGAQALVVGNDFVDGGCYAHFAGKQLTIGNDSIRRRWRVEGGGLFATSFYDLAGQVEWIDTPASLPSPAPPGERLHGAIEMRGGAGTFGPTQARSLVVELTTTSGPTSVVYRFQVFPNASGIRLSIARHGGGDGMHADRGADQPASGDVVEHFLSDRQHLKFTQVTLRDRTDTRNELVFEDEWLLQPNEAYLGLQGNVFTLEDTLTGTGLVFLKEAPQPEMRPVPTANDAVIKGSDTLLERTTQTRRTFYDIAFYGHGFQNDGQGYASALIAYHGGRIGRIEALQRYQRQIRVYRPDRDGQLLSNTWGDRSGSSKLNDAFIRREIDAGKKVGIDIVQVDDGWEKGKTITNQVSGGVWEGFRGAQADFWQTSDSRFPQGFLPLSSYAQAQGMRLGKWFAPDSSEDFGNWQLDADQILDWHKRDDIAAFKFDSVKIRSKQGEANYHALTDRVLQGSSGSILLDLDVTAETRQGYFGNIEAGPLFVENRYTDWHRYWPHQTLRNLWKLAQYVDPIRLRMEFLNAERNQSLYSGDPLAPSQYDSSTLFATTMVASPLAWLETSSLSPAYIAHARPLIAEWKRQREAMYRGFTIPIGEAPDGTTWTGFQSAMDDGRSGYLLVFRELNAHPKWTTTRGLLTANHYRIRILGGEGKVTQTRDGFDVTVPSTLGFVWARLEAGNPAHGER